MGIKAPMQTFASMAEARANYYERGYETVNRTDDGNRYVMVRTTGGALDPMFELVKVGFLTVHVNEVN